VGRGRVPLRTCVGCRISRPRPELVRFTVRGERVVMDPLGRMPGRGAYVCPEPACLRAALKKERLARALRVGPAATAGLAEVYSPFLARMAEEARKEGVGEAPWASGCTS
jgi:predicted RNA-binding protein YlxR (DUF448 family)